MRKIFADNHHIPFQTFICVLLVLITFFLYRPVGEFDFISLDDTEYVTENPYVKNGITEKGIRWAFRFPNFGYWHPLTWVSHMLDCELYGPAPGRHHRTNLLFHIANVILLFSIFNISTGETGKSALLAAIFAVHPLNVESVAWVAERKNLLSTFFWFLTTIAYIFFTRKPSALRYMLCITFFIAGLLSKPMLVTLPFVLLLMDYWPLQRFEFKQILSPHFVPVFLEKIPFFIFSGISIALTTLSVRHFHINISADIVPMGFRFASAPVLYLRYLDKIFRPADLAVFYPYPRSIVLWQVIVASAVLAGISFFAFKKIKNSPWFAMGWFWFLGTLFPVIGLKQAGIWPAIADRWTYIPAVGIYIAVIWGLYNLIKKKHVPPKKIIALSIIIICIYAALARQQMQYWQNSILLYEHTLKITKENDIIHYNLASAMMDDPSRKKEVVYHFSEALRINPRYLQARNNLGVYMLRLGKDREALAHFLKVLQTDPEDITAHNNAGGILARYGKTAEAVRHFKEIIHIDPENAEAYGNWGIALAQQGKISQAIRCFRKALEIDPDSERTKNNLRQALEDMKTEKKDG